MFYVESMNICIVKCDIKGPVLARIIVILVCYVYCKISRAGAPQ